MDASPWSPSLRRLASWATVIVVPLAAFFILQSLRPDPFATSNDNWLYFTPLIDAHTSSLSHGKLLRMIWQLGAGWTPWESGQSGVLWPLYPLAALVHWLVGERLSLLDASALLSLVATSVTAQLLLTPKLVGPVRPALACAIALAPGPILIGLNWHDYFAPAPAVVATMLLLVRLARGEEAPRFAHVGVLVASVLCFTAAHVQMYAIGVVYLGAFVIAVADSARSAWRALMALALAQAPLLLPMLAFKTASLHIAPAWIASHEGGRGLINEAAPPWTLLVATISGALADATQVAAQLRDFYYNPLFLLVIAAVIMRRRGRALPWLLLSVAMLGPTMVPGLHHVAIGPFAGFRWTYKVIVYVGPMTLLFAALLWHERHASGRRIHALWAALIALQVLVIVHGASWGTLRNAHAIGARGLRDRGQDCAAQLGLAPGTRVAVVGRFRNAYALNAPLPLLALATNATIGFELESAHLYEPMEPAAAALAHGSLGPLWRDNVAASALTPDRVGAELATLRHIGVQALLAARADQLLAFTDVRSCTVALERVFMARVPDAPTVPFPWYVVDGRQLPFERALDGRLTTTTALEVAPSSSSPREMAWQRLPDGRWRGTPPLAPPRVVEGTLAIFALALFVAVRRDRRR